MADIAEYGNSDSDSSDKWDGKPPADADPWCKSLFNLIERTAGLLTWWHGGADIEPNWWTENDTEFLEAEEERRGIPGGSLAPLENVAYHSDLHIEVYATGRTAKVDGLLFGKGEKIGEWDAFTLFFVNPSVSKLCTLGVGLEVYVGEYGDHEDAVVTRILRGIKAAGTAASGKMQYSYYVLLKVGATYKYAALQHVHNAGRGHRISMDGGFDIPFYNGYLQSDEPAWVPDFTPKSVSAVAKEAAKYVGLLAGEPKPTPAKKPKLSVHTAKRMPPPTRTSTAGGSRLGTRSVRASTHPGSYAEEDSEEGVCGLLNKAVYGTRDAAQNWEFAYVEFRLVRGFRKKGKHHRACSTIRRRIREW